MFKTDEWIKKWYGHILEYYLTKKRMGKFYNNDDP